MKERCPVFDVECGYMSSCYTIREERCIESMDRAGKKVPPEDATRQEKEAWMTKLIRKKRLKSERKK